MPLYEIRAFCDHCDDPHRLGMTIRRDDPNLDKKTIGDIYSGKSLPNDLLLLNNTFRCPTTGKQYKVKDNQQAFLVAISE